MQNNSHSIPTNSFTIETQGHNGIPYKSVSPFTAAISGESIKLHKLGARQRFLPEIRIFCRSQKQDERLLPTRIVPAVSANCALKIFISNVAAAVATLPTL